jgi:hypothetical protein
MREEIENRLNSGNAYCHSVQNLLSSCLLLKNIKVKMYTHLVLPVKREEATGDWRKLHSEELSDLDSLDIMQLVNSKRWKSLGSILHPGLVMVLWPGGYGPPLYSHNLTPILPSFWAP